MLPLPGLELSVSHRVYLRSGVLSTGVRSPALPYILTVLGALASCGASYRTTNFLVNAATVEQAAAIAQDAERVRRRLALEWLDRELAPWTEPCPLVVVVNERMAPRGETSYVFRNGRPTAWQMRVEGPWLTIRHSVLPHEVAHAVFASHFGRSVPRWAEEGACVVVEHSEDQRKLEEALGRYFDDGRMLALSHLLSMDAYPGDVMVMYAQAYSLVSFFVAKGGKQKFVHYVGEAMKDRDWRTATRKHYGYRDLAQLEQDWLSWVDPVR